MAHTRQKSFQPFDKDKSPIFVIPRYARLANTVSPDIDIGSK